MTERRRRGDAPWFSEKESRRPQKRSAQLQVAANLAQVDDAAVNSLIIANLVVNSLA